MTTFPTPDFSFNELEDMKAHAVSAWPRESCGIVVDDIYHPCENIAPDPENSFLIADSIILAAGSNLQAVVHSHPTGGRSPSQADMQSQMSLGCIFGIVPCNQNEVTGPISWWGDFLLEQPLVGQEFVHGITDCFTTVRAWFWQVKGVKLIDLPRDADWWNDDQNLYLQNFQRIGFEIVDRKDVVEGDCFIGKVRSTVPNHGGVILDRGLGLHHLDGRLSRREPILRWERFITHYLRYVGS